MTNTDIPKEMRAIKFQSKGKAAVETVPVPKLRPGFVLIKVKTVALNPTDWKHIDYVSTKHNTCICDYAGDIVAVGEGVEKQWKVGDRVCGAAHGGNDTQPEDGAGGDYAIAKADVQIRIPDGMSYEDACTLGIAVTTVGQGFYYEFGLPWPNEGKEKKSILIYGGSTATGAIAIQLAKLSGWEIYTTCSPRNFDFVKSLGADHVFDYSSSSCAADIRAKSNNGIYYAYDTISNEGSSKICVDSVASAPSPDGGKPKYCCLVAIKEFPKDKVDYHYTFAYETMGEPFEKFGKKFEVKADLFNFTKEVVTRVEDLLKAGKLKPTKTDVRDGGLDAVLPSLDELRQNKVSGKKIVVKIA